MSFFRKYYNNTKFISITAMPKEASVTILLPENEKQILEDYCHRTGRTQTDILRATIRELVEELPFYYGILGCGGNPIKIFMGDGRKLTEEQLLDECPDGYKYWKASTQKQ